MVERHEHTGVDSPQIDLKRAVYNSPQEAITPATGTAGGTYSATEQGIINAHTATINEIITKLQNLGLLK